MIGWIIMYTVFGLVMLAVSIAGHVAGGLGTLNGPDLSPADGYFISGLLFASAVFAAWSEIDCRRTMRRHFG